MLACLQPVNDEVAFGSKKTKGWRVPVTIASSPKTPHSATNAVAPPAWGWGGGWGEPQARVRTLKADALP
jgi:hypothetical protein